MCLDTRCTIKPPQGTLLRILLICTPRGPSREKLRTLKWPVCNGVGGNQSLWKIPSVYREYSMGRWGPLDHHNSRSLPYRTIFSQDSIAAFRSGIDVSSPSLTSLMTGIWTGSALAFDPWFCILIFCTPRRQGNLICKHAKHSLTFYQSSSKDSISTILRGPDGMRKASDPYELIISLIRVGGQTL